MSRPEPMAQELKDCIFSLLHQFGYDGEDENGRPFLYTGGLSTFEGVFRTLGWDERKPHYLDEDEEWQEWLTR